MATPEKGKAVKRCYSYLPANIFLIVYIITVYILSAKSDLPQLSHTKAIQTRYTHKVTILQSTCKLLSITRNISSFALLCASVLKERKRKKED